MTTPSTLFAQLQLAEATYALLTVCRLRMK
jgi:hypothetical protein